ncbi:MAG: Gfo/Idh/MocA family oxidoreductase [Pseudomonadales bacterium]
MAIAYSAVLQNLGAEFRVFGRSAESAAAFLEATGQSVDLQPFAEAQHEHDLALPSAAIVAVSTDQLCGVTNALIDAGVRRILVEKPGALAVAQLEECLQRASTAGAEVFLGYNRRFYASVHKAREIAAADGGITSASFEVTEWGHVIAKLQKSSTELGAWFLANTSHVVDLVWHLCGKPTQLECLQSGSLDWHPTASAFAGAGATDKGVLFSYIGNWSAPGRWSIECCTRAHRLIFRPMEQLQIQELGSIEVSSVALDDALDQAFKPGVYRQTQAFLVGDDSNLCGLAEHCESARTYATMAGYS